MISLKIIQPNIPAKLNSQQLVAEIAAALSIDPALIGLQATLGELRIVRSSLEGLTEEVHPPFIEITLPDGVDASAVEAIVGAHAPSKSDFEEVAAAQAAELKAQLSALSSDPEMIALIKAAANS